MAEATASLLDPFAYKEEVLRMRPPEMHENKFLLVAEIVYGRLLAYLDGDISDEDYDKLTDFLLEKNRWLDTQYAATASTYFQAMCLIARHKELGHSKVRSSWSGYNKT